MIVFLRRLLGGPLLGLALSLAFLGNSGHAAPGEDRRLNWLAGADPVHDSQAAIAKKDFRFWAVNGIAAGMVLGTDQFGKDQALIQACGIRTISGTSDTSSDPLNMKASQYAAAYNSELIRYFRATPAVREHILHKNH